MKTRKTTERALNAGTTTASANAEMRTMTNEWEDEEEFAQDVTKWLHLRLAWLWGCECGWCRPTTLVTKIIIRAPPERDTSITWEKTSLRMSLKEFVRPYIRKGWNTARITSLVINMTQSDFKGKYLLGTLLERIKATVRVERCRMRARA